ncbi:MAG TPA: hypothetical protein VJZ71_05985 [Phycisphaerae bacterium]|nr:hypothetical protein [Phycisphaerae bacterium]
MIAHTFSHESNFWLRPWQTLPFDRGIDSDPQPFGSPDYGKEEFVAEIAAAFLAETTAAGQETRYCRRRSRSEGV